MQVERAEHIIFMSIVMLEGSRLEGGNLNYT